MAIRKAGVMITTAETARRDEDKVACI